VTAPRPTTPRPTGSAPGSASGDAPPGPLVRITEYTDPACPWAWGSEPKFRRLRAALGPHAAWRRVFGILFDEGEEPAPDPAAEAAWYLAELVEISSHTGAPYPAQLARVAASSWPMALAAKAAEDQGPVIAEVVLERLRETTFLDGAPADTPQRVLAALAGVPGLDLDLLARTAAGSAAREAVRRDWAETRSPCAFVLGLDEPGRHPGRAKPLGERESDGYRYALPTLVFEGEAGRAVVPGWRDPSEYLAAAGRVAPGLPGRCAAGESASQ
jgi:predicted DsbA family dithiol-disulfide isomerase